LSADRFKPGPLNFNVDTGIDNDERIKIKQLLYLGTSEHDLPRYEYKKHDFGLDHAVDETREQLLA
jgi:hypothetical protein